jgi:uncharacterized protein
VLFRLVPALLLGFALAGATLPARAQSLAESILARAASGESLGVAPVPTTLDTVAPELGAPRAYVTDDAGILSAREELSLDRYLGKIERELGSQFALVTIATAQPRTIEEVAVELFADWGIGGAKADEGLLLLVAVTDRKVRFEVGYGLEGVLPDGRVGGIIRERITPDFRRGDYAAGLEAGLVEAARFVAESKGLPPPLPDDRPAPRKRRPASVPLIVILVVLFMVVSLIMGSINGGGGGRGRRRRRSGWEPFILGSGWGGGGFGGGSSGGGGGGFGGFGGGMSGGGGATGSW